MSGVDTLVDGDASASIQTDETTELQLPSAARHVAKRADDSADGVLGLLVTLSQMLVIALLLNCNSRRPVFAQTQVGQGDRQFRWLKRTEDLAARLAGVLRDPSQAGEFRASHELEDDTRIRRMGCYLRGGSLDELPKFPNVLGGHKSVVDPRPTVDGELIRYCDSAVQHLAVRPDVTGPWQVAGRSDTTFEQRVTMAHFFVAKSTSAAKEPLTLRTVDVPLRRANAH